MTEPYELYYWPILPGRGEFVRLVLEEVGVPCRDVARLPEEDGGGFKPLLAFMQGERPGQPAYAPPVLVHGAMVLVVGMVLGIWLPRIRWQRRTRYDRF